MLFLSRKNVQLAIDPIVHESYGSNRFSNNIDGDIALLKLAEKINLDIYTPACLPPLKANYTGQTGTVYGG
jgi:hypothetical protein